MKVVVAVCLELKIINPPPKRGFETKIDALKPIHTFVYIQHNTCDSKY